MRCMSQETWGRGSYKKRGRENAAMGKVSNDTKLSFCFKLQPVLVCGRGHFPSIRPPLYQRNNKDRKWSGSDRASERGRENR